MKSRFVYAVILLWVFIFFTGCGGGGEEKALTQLYTEYRQALQNEDIAALKTYISSKRQEDMPGEGAAMQIKLIKEMMPPEVKTTKVEVSGDTAKMEVEGQMGKQRMTGEVEFLRENGSWKIDKESWQMNFDMTGEGDGGSTPGYAEYAGYASPFMKSPADMPGARQILTGHQGEVSALAFTPDNRFLVSASYGDYSLRVWDPVSGEQLSGVKTPNRVRGMEITADGSDIITADAYNTIIIWPLSGGTVGEPRELFKEAGDALALSPDDKYLVTTAWQKPVKLWDFKAKEFIKTISDKTNLRVLAFSFKGDLLAGGGDGVEYSLRETKKWREKTYGIGKVMKDSGISSIDMSRDGKYMVTGHTDSSIVIFNLPKRRELHNFYVRDAAVMAVKISPDSKVLATAHYDKKIYLWDLETGKRLGVLAKHTDAVQSLAFSQDGSLLVSGGQDRNIITWSSGTAELPVTGQGGASEPLPADQPGGSETPDAHEPVDPGDRLVEVAGQLNLVNYPDARSFTRHWQTKGEVSLIKDPEQEDNYNFIIRYGGMIWQDVRINADGKYALSIAWASSERVNPDGDQTGLPYLYGYMLNRADINKIDSYLQGEHMMLKPSSENEWGIIYGIFEIPPGTGAIRLFMQQADGGLPQDGSAARFDDPGIFIFDTLEQAEAFIKEY